jgi:hypothetical protein
MRLTLSHSDRRASRPIDALSDQPFDRKGLISRESGGGGNEPAEHFNRGEVALNPRRARLVAWAAMVTAEEIVRVAVFADLERAERERLSRVVADS